MLKGGKESLARIMENFGPSYEEDNGSKFNAQFNLVKLREKMFLIFEHGACTIGHMWEENASG